MKSLIVVGAVLVSSTNAGAQSQEDWIVLRQLAASVMQVQAMVDGNASTASAVSVIRMGRQRDEQEWLVF